MASLDDRSGKDVLMDLRSCTIVFFAPFQEALNETDFDERQKTFARSAAGYKQLAKIVMADCPTPQEALEADILVFQNCPQDRFPNLLINKKIFFVRATDTKFDEFYCSPKLVSKPQKSTESTTRKH